MSDQLAQITEMFMQLNDSLNALDARLNCLETDSDELHLGMCDMQATLTKINKRLQQGDIILASPSPFAWDRKGL